MTIAYLLYQAENNTNTTANGGRMTNKLVNRASAYPIVPPQEQATGVARLRKMFLKIADTANTPILRAMVFLRYPTTLAGTRAYFMPATQRDTVATMGTPRKYATGVLNADVAIGATSLVVNFETGSAADLVVQAGDVLMIRDAVNQEIALEVASAPVWTGEQAAIALVAGTANAYLAGSFVGSCYVKTDVNTSVDNLVKTFSTSTFDEVTHPIALENLSTIEQTITLTFTSASAFTVLSDKLGALQNGSVFSDYAPVNADFALPYFTIPALAWGGSGTIGETLVFQTHPAALPIWSEHQVYASETSVSIGDFLPLAFITDH